MKLNIHINIHKVKHTQRPKPARSQPLHLIRAHTLRYGNQRRSNKLLLLSTVLTEVPHWTCVCVCLVCVRALCRPHCLLFYMWVIFMIFFPSTADRSVIRPAPRASLVESGPLWSPSKKKREKRQTIFWASDTFVRKHPVSGELSLGWHGSLSAIHFKVLACR
jgi:hypothetical protein